MAVPKIHLETTMFSFYYEERTEARYQELKAQVRRVFDLIKAGTYEPYTSAYAIAVNGLDFIVSLNFGHIARPWTIERVRRVNARENYQGVGIYKPAEVWEL